MWSCDDDPRGCDIAVLDIAHSDHFIEIVSMLRPPGRQVRVRLSSHHQRRKTLSSPSHHPLVSLPTSGALARLPFVSNGSSAQTTGYQCLHSCLCIIRLVRVSVRFNVCGCHWHNWRPWLHIWRDSLIHILSRCRWRTRRHRLHPATPAVHLVLQDRCW